MNKIDKELTLFRQRIKETYINTKKVSDLVTFLKNTLAHNYHKFSSLDYSILLGNRLLLVDIRENTYFKSKRSNSTTPEQWFGPSSLKELFESYPNIEYVHAKSLGNPKEIRSPFMQSVKALEKAYKKFKRNYPESSHELEQLKQEFITILLEKAKFYYIEYIKTEPEAKKIIEKLFNLLERKQNKIIIVLMCYCQPEKKFCHRFAVIEHLVNLKREQLTLEPTQMSLYFGYDTNKGVIQKI